MEGDSDGGERQADDFVKASKGPFSARRDLQPNDVGSLCISCLSVKTFMTFQYESPDLSLRSSAHPGRLQKLQAVKSIIDMLATRIRSKREPKKKKETEI